MNRKTKRMSLSAAMLPVVTIFSTIPFADDIMFCILTSIIGKPFFYAYLFSFFIKSLYFPSILLVPSIASKLVAGLILLCFRGKYSNDDCLFLGILIISFISTVLMLPLAGMPLATLFGSGLTHIPTYIFLACINFLSVLAIEIPLSAILYWFLWKENINTLRVEKIIPEELRV